MRAFDALVAATPGAVPVRLALEQADGSVFRFDTRVLPESHPQAAAQRSRISSGFVKFLLWSRGGWRIYVDGPATLAAALAAHYRDTATGRFDAHLVGERMFDHPLEVVHTRDLPPERSTTKPLGRHLDGCRIGFDLGGSDRKVAAVIDGRVVFSDETVWDPYHKPDPQYHFDGIMDSLKQGRRAPAARRRHRRQRRRRLREQPRQGRLALSRRAAGPVRCARQGPVPRGAGERGTTCRSRWSTTAR